MCYIDRLIILAYIQFMIRTSTLPMVLHFGMGNRNNINLLYYTFHNIFVIEESICHFAKWQIDSFY